MGRKKKKVKESAARLNFTGVEHYCHISKQKRRMNSSGRGLASLSGFCFSWFDLQKHLPESTSK